MKKLLITMTMLLTLGMGTQAVAQKHRHTPQAELVDSTNTDAVEVYSDTTSMDTASSKVKSKVTVTTRTSPWTSYTRTYEADDEDFGSMISHIFTDMSGNEMAGVILMLGILFILFVLAPVLIIIAIFYFINKNRREKMKLAQMAMQQGQPIPENLLDQKDGNVTDEYQSGLRQCFVGVGLMIFLGLTAEEVGFGIGALVFCIGLGKIVSAKMAARNNNLNQNNNYDKETGTF